MKRSALWGHMMTKSSIDWGVSNTKQASDEELNEAL